MPTYDHVVTFWLHRSSLCRAKMSVTHSPEKSNCPAATLTTKDQAKHGKTFIHYFIYLIARHGHSLLLKRGVSTQKVFRERCVSPKGIFEEEFAPPKDIFEEGCAPPKEGEPQIEIILAGSAMGDIADATLLAARR